MSADLTPEPGVARSPDGTALGFTRIGAGPPLVVCHGAFATAQDWLPFAERMAGSRTVYLYDRRGRGSSPCAGDFAIDAEVDDLGTIVALAGPGAAVLGHSFGGGCALAFAARRAFSGPLIVYEPRYSDAGPISRGHIGDIEERLAADDREGAVAAFMEHVAVAPAQAIAAFRQSPLWQVMLRTVEAVPRELRFLDTLAWRPGDLDAVAGPVTLLVGENSPIPPGGARDASLRALLPAITTVTIPGQGHFAYAMAPDLMAEIVGRCLRAAKE